MTTRYILVHGRMKAEGGSWYWYPVGVEVLSLSLPLSVSFSLVKKMNFKIDLGSFVTAAIENRYDIKEERIFP